MRRLARGNRILIVENLYRITPPRPTSAGQAVRMLAKAWRVLKELRLVPRTIEPNIQLISGPVVPGRIVKSIVWPLLRRGVRRFVESGRGRRPVLWVAFPSPLLDGLFREIPESLVVYDCASAFADDPAVPRAVVDAERRLLRLAHLVFTDSRSLWERHRRAHERCHWIPTGVDVARFGNGRAEPRRWSEPVVGYTGTIHAWLDTDLIVQVARLRPGWRFVFAGPRRERAAADRLLAVPNVEFLGPQPHDTLPDLVAQFTAAWIPYQVTEFTRHVFPTKMLEYLAAGKPVVSTDLPEVRAFSPPVRIADSAERIVASLEEAMRGDDGAPGRDLATGYDWSVQIATVQQYLDAALEVRARS